MDKHEQSWVYRCVSPECGLTGVVRDADLRSLRAAGPITCPYSGHRMDRIRKATEQDQKELEPLIPVVREAGGPIILQADPWWPMKNIRVVTNRIFFGLGSTPYLSEYMRPVNPCPSGEERDSAEADRSVDYLTEEDVAEHFSVSVRAVRRWVSEKKLKPIRLTKKNKVFTWVLIDEFIKREAGVPGAQDFVNQPARTQPFSPIRRSMSLDDSRALLRDLKHKR